MAISKHTDDAAPQGEMVAAACRLTSEQVWKALERASFAVLSHVTPSGDPRSSGVVYKVVDQRLYVAVAPDSWKARHIAADGRVAVTVTVRRGGILSLVAPIPPATVSFRASATVHDAGSARARAILRELRSLLPPDSQDTGAIIEINPEGMFVTYGIGVSLRTMLDPEASKARVPVSVSQ